jgi:hypothetical protein
LFNWQETQQIAALNPDDFHLDTQQNWIVREFWSNTVYPADTRVEVFLPSHGVALFAVRRLDSAKPAYLGSSLHFLQGLELGAWEPRPDGLSLRLERPGRAQGFIDLYLPDPPRAAHLDGTPLTWQEIAPKCYRLSIAFQQQAGLTIDY